MYEYIMNFRKYQKYETYLPVVIRNIFLNKIASYGRDQVASESFAFIY